MTCVVGLLELTQGRNRYQEFDTATKLCLVLELGSGGDVYEYIRKNGKFSEPRARDIFAQLVLALQYCHRHRVVHRDLKPENVIFCTDPVTGEKDRIIKITDFGFSTDKASGPLDTFCGSMCAATTTLMRRRSKDSLGNFIGCTRRPKCYCKSHTMGPVLIFGVLEFCYTCSLVVVCHLMGQMPKL